MAQPLKYNTIEVLKQWLHFPNYKVVYSSEEEEVSARQINSKIEGKSDITIVITTTDGNVFGSYHQNPIKKKPLKFYDRHIQRGGYFLFTITNPYNIPPTRFVTKNMDDYLVLYSDDNPNSLISMCYVYDLKLNGSTINTDFPFYYNTEYPSTIFTGSVIPTTFNFENIIILQWYL
ncbi:hypothetical protein EIN_406070 [Entamoeba invadens IP1]|uniref:TLDc domain-containing protein n=1 Tax=Entamoeba invadens IP1 TaxID=370355 RepID=A0A0A1U6W2_ENTIV|nr:hypothetical protein EIN_406070 [Entamoeba invadens IP1]ELP90153.1 hypothetical protein EIN_406070 [Entamoeba invadens IP1]|eukprot:XP_004256924.1 hypothetical protein EIN_406070 [Entamoeba invadens IP1]